MTAWHKFGIYVGLFMIIVGGMMYIPDYARWKIQRDYRHSQLTSSVWLEQENIRKRSKVYTECLHRTKFEQEQCASESFQKYPDRNWKQVADENAQKGL